MSAVGKSGRDGVHRVSVANETLIGHPHAIDTTFTYKGKTVDTRTVGRELNVRYVLEGSVRRAGSLHFANCALVFAPTPAAL